MDIIRTLIYISIFLGFFTLSFYLLGFLERKKPQKRIKNYLISIIVPAYNEEDCLEKTVESLQNLNYPHKKIEILIVNDGSTDKTKLIGKKLEKKYDNVKLYSKKNGGKGSALNYGIALSKGELIAGFDSDSMVTPEALNHMLPYFNDPRVASVTPALKIYKPKGLWCRIQAIEYDLGIFLRKAFSMVNAIHVTPGPFSIYRRTFFEKHGGYDENNITEDMEIALRIQSNGYIIENSPHALVYTIGPNKLAALTKQRRRWYFGMIRNLVAYRKLFSKKYGEMGILILPMAIISIVTVMIITAYALTKSIIDFVRDINLYSAIGFDFINNLNLKWYVFYLSLSRSFSEGIVLFSILFFAISIFLLIFVNKRVKSVDSSKTIFLNYLPFLILYSILFSFWWVISIIYSLTAKKIEW